jgi:hypothetical protein
MHYIKLTISSVTEYNNEIHACLHLMCNFRKIKIDLGKSIRQRQYKNDIYNIHALIIEGLNKLEAILIKLTTNYEIYGMYFNQIGVISHRCTQPQQLCRHFLRQEYP